jgi:hypothetical protein
MQNASRQSFWAVDSFALVTLIFVLAMLILVLDYFGGIVVDYGEVV